MPLILGTNSIKDTGYDVANSLRLNSGSSEYIQRTYGTPTNAKIFGLSWWIKMSGDPVLGTGQFDLWGERTDSSNRVFMGIDGVGQFDFFEKNGGSNVLELETRRLFRDNGAWYHFLLLGDSTQSTASNRIKLYINGVQETSFVTETYPSQNYEFRLAVNSTKYFGRIGLGSQLSTNYFDGYLAEVAFVDGTITSHTDYGEFDSDTPNVWKPKDISGLTFGNNGFHLDFQDSSALGNDVSGNNNDFTINNLTSIDQSTDTCTNNFCTMNPLYPDGGITFSEGNLKLNRSSSSWRSAGGTIAVSKGKWYWETKTTGDYTFVGFADIQLFNEGCSVRESFTTGATTTGTAFSLRNNDPVIHSVSTSGGQTYLSGSYSASAFTSATIGIALNLDDNEASWYIDGTIQNSGTPLSISAGNYIPGISIYATGVELNFGSPPYSISSGNSDGNGYGNFEYSVPSGYYSICTKNLSEFG